MKAIVAINSKRYIGKDGDMMWHSPEDLKHFKNKTKNSTCLIGRKTYDSLPESMKSKDDSRTYLVVSRNPDRGISLKQALMAKPDWVIGGAEIYKKLLPQCDELHISYINNDDEGDVKLEPIGFLRLFTNKCKIFRYHFNTKGFVDDGLKTSDEWNQEQLKGDEPWLLMDPDGWDRSGDYEYSFYIERITQEEFTSRLMRSTCLKKRVETKEGK
jgi:dihydrofolate reductase